MYRYDEVNVQHLLPNVHVGHTIRNFQYAYPLSGTDNIADLESTFLIGINGKILWEMKMGVNMG